ncbi:MAG: SpoIIE family protein phosphatase [Bacteroidia bacterium]|nr:SpoIIE family protein phosphatase [Bacteroidia bacterium]MDW8088868.1 SpoIIE family protein phosphatase [Bacteroidia bacterium]
MALFGLGTTLKAPFPGVRYDPATGKILSRNEAWETLSPEAQAQALSLPSWDFLRENGRIWVKHLLPSENGIETFFLLPAEGYYEALQRLEKVEGEAHFLREQLHAFVQNVPLPLFVVEEKLLEGGEGRIIFANKLLLDLLGLPLARLYQGLQLKDILGPAESMGRALLSQALTARQPVQDTLIRPTESGERYWILRAFPFQSSSLTGIMVGIVDITHEKEQERALAEAYQELQVQAEELKQQQEELLVLNEALEEARRESEARRKELEESLIAAQRYQRTLLLRTRLLYEVWGYERVAVTARPHAYVGGDFLIVRRREPYLYVGIGDATGHGSSGALLAATVQALIHEALLLLPSPAALHQTLEEVRRELAEILEVNLGQQISTDGAEVGLVALPLHPSPETPLYLATAGRAVYLLTPEGHLQEFIQGKRALGWSMSGWEVEPYTTQALPYPAGATLFLFSDGLTDQLNPQGKRLGKKLFLHWLEGSQAAGPDPRAKTRFILQQWNQWKGEDTPQTDDLLLLALQL